MPLTVTELVPWKFQGTKQYSVSYIASNATKARVDEILSLLASTTKNSSSHMKDTGMLSRFSLGLACDLHPRDDGKKLSIGRSFRSSASGFASSVRSTVAMCGRNQARKDDAVVPQSYRNPTRSFRGDHLRRASLQVLED